MNERNNANLLDIFLHVVPVPALISGVGCIEIKVVGGSMYVSLVIWDGEGKVTIV